MTELATINAKIDRLNRKLKADPIAFTIPFPVPRRRAQERGHQLLSTAAMQGIIYRDSIAFRFTNLDDCLVIWDEARDVSNRASAEFVHRDIKLFARKIQLAILERLTVSPTKL